jgi:hypothetical protein
MAYPYIIQGSNIVVVIGNKSYTVSKTHVTYQKVLDAIKAQDWEAVKAVVDPKKVVLNYGKGNVSVQGETLFWKGEQLNGGLAVRMITMLQEGFPIEPMVAFMENLFTNPSKRAVTELYGFLKRTTCQSLQMVTSWHIRKFVATSSISIAALWITVLARFLKWNAMQLTTTRIALAAPVCTSVV